MQNEITEPSDLHNENGELIQKGWAKKLILHLNRKNIPAKKIRIKDWDCYEILNPEFCFVFIIADIGYFGMATYDLLDIKNKNKKSGGGLKLFTKGSLNMPLTSEEGDLSFSNKVMNMTFKKDGPHTVITINDPKFNKGEGIKGQVTCYFDPYLESIVNVVPFKKKKHYVYVQKIMGMRVAGEIQIGEEMYKIGDESQGYLDWSRGSFPYKTNWYWGGAAGKVDGKQFSFNIDYGFGDESHASKNMLFYEGKGHKIGEVEFHYDKKDVMKPWKFTSSDGRFEMIMDPVVFDKEDKLNIGILKNSGHQVFGYFNGCVILDDDTKIEVDKMFGFAENFYHRW
jgi:hypothetical protein